MSLLSPGIGKMKRKMPDSGSELGWSNPFTHEDNRYATCASVFDDAIFPG